MTEDIDELGTTLDEDAIELTRLLDTMADDDSEELEIALLLSKTVDEIADELGTLVDETRDEDSTDDDEYDDDDDEDGHSHRTNA